MAIVPFIIIAVTIGVTGQILIKKGLNQLGILNFSANIVSTYLKIFYSPYVIFGILTYIFSIFLWLYALSRVDLSFAYPFLALSYALVISCSWLFLGEAIPLLRLIGVLVICFGVFLVSRT
jgi:drug/metabolite transporter (DMT)-like permease